MLDKLYSYEHLHLPQGVGTMTQVIVWIALGVAIATILGCVDKCCATGLLRALKAAGAVDRAHASPLASLSVRGKWYLRFALRAGRPLSRYVLPVYPDVPEEADGAAHDPKSKRKTGRGGIICDDTPLYLPEETRAEAEVRFDSGKNPVRTCVLGLLLLVLLAVFVRFALPELLQMLDNFIGTL